MCIETEIISTEEITLSEFHTDISTESRYLVDINSLIGICGASPVRVHYETETINVDEIFPEKIWLKNGNNYVSIGMINKIIKRVDDLGAISYEIQCGDMEEFSMTINIMQL